jgi:VanZ family protein
MLSFIKKYLVTLLLAATIVLACLLPMPEVPMAANVPLFDKWTHMLMYVCLCTALWAEYWRCHERTTLAGHLRRHAPRLILLAVGAPMAMSGALELLQAYATTTRNGDWLDFAANSLGVIIGAACSYPLKHL